MFWESYTHAEMKRIVFGALEENLNYRTNPVLGLPASYLDPEVFYHDAPFLKDAPFLSTMIANPNHIGCHTLTDSEVAFKGTHKIERELIDLCAKQIFEGGDENFDGYVASGGTEANIQGMWVLKNYFINEFNAKPEEIALVYSEDSHYSMPKGAALLSLKRVVTEVDTNTRRVIKKSLIDGIQKAKNTGVKHFIVIMNMSTTMFGSVDDLEEITSWLDSLAIDYKVHVDGAYGGFIYPFVADNNHYTFKNPKIFSFSLDGHKMLQSPYGTGIYLVRKGYMHHALTEEANYVKGKDYTLIGSRSGANAIAVWMIMRTYGSEGWTNKIKKLIQKTNRLCDDLKDRGVEFFRNPKMNIITIKARYIGSDLAQKYLLVPDSHDKPTWYKIVVMEHVTQGLIDRFLLDLDASRDLH